MKRLIDRLKSDKTQQAGPGTAEQTTVSARVRSRPEPNDEHVDESSSGWFGTHQSDSSVFDTGSLRIEKSEEENAVSQKTLELVNDSPSGGEDETSFGPYNCGRFQSKVK